MLIMQWVNQVDMGAIVVPELMPVEEAGGVLRAILLLLVSTKQM